MPEIFAFDVATLEDEHNPPLMASLFLGWRDVGRNRTMLFASSEDSVAVLGPPRVGKTSGLLLPQALTWSGSLISASTKPDVLRATRGRRLQIALQRDGDVFVYAPTDPREVIDGVHKIHWSPIDGCDNSTTCDLRVRRMMGPQNEKDDEFFREQGAALMRGYFHAAALANLPMRRVKVWLGLQDTDEAVRILQHYADHSAAALNYASDLEGIGRQAGETKAGTFGTARTALAAVSGSANALENCEYTDFDIEHFLDSGSTLYIVSEGDSQEQVAPLVAGLVEAIVSRAYQKATRNPSGRLDPPLLLLLDEVGAIAPLPTLPMIMSQGASQGVLCTWASQDLRQLHARWGDKWAGAIWGASSQKVMFGGLQDGQLLEETSKLMGEYDRRMPLKTGFAALAHVLSTKQPVGEHITKERIVPVETLHAMPPGQAMLLASTPQGRQHTVVGTPPAHTVAPFAGPVLREGELQRSLFEGLQATPDDLRHRGYAELSFATLAPKERARFAAEEHALAQTLQEYHRATPSQRQRLIERHPNLATEAEAAAVVAGTSPTDQARFRRDVIDAFASGQIQHFGYTLGARAPQREAADRGTTTSRPRRPRGAPPPLSRPPDPHGARGALGTESPTTAEPGAQPLADRTPTAPLKPRTPRGTGFRPGLPHREPERYGGGGPG